MLDKTLPEAVPIYPLLKSKWNKEMHLLFQKENNQNFPDTLLRLTSESRHLHSH